jgi:hypothetical protein
LRVPLSVFDGARVEVRDAPALSVETGGIDFKAAAPVLKDPPSSIAPAREEENA